VASQADSGKLQGSAGADFGSSREVAIRLPPDPTQDATAIRAKLESALQSIDKSAQVEQLEIVGPQVGSELKTSASWALFFTLC